MESSKIASLIINHRKTMFRVSFSLLAIATAIYFLFGEVSFGAKVLSLAKCLFYISIGWIYGKSDLRDKSILVFSCYVFIAIGFWTFINAIIAYVTILVTEFPNFGVKGSIIIQGVSAGLSFVTAGTNMLVKFYSD